MSKAAPKHTLMLIIKKPPTGLPKGRTINPGDTLLIDERRTPKPGDIVWLPTGVEAFGNHDPEDVLGVVVGRQERWK